MKKRTKTLILCISIFVVAAASAFGLWFLLRDKAPVGNGNVLNVAWYHENGTEFTITTADELFELAELSEHYNFEGQTIKLGADIVVNEGNAADWENTLPERRWETIIGFAGTFDGQGHTISGLYGMGHLYGLKGTEKIYYTTGLFADTQPECVIKNFKLLNSYFCSDLNQGVGSISSYGGGTFENIYSDAIIVSYKSNNGGIIGALNKKGTITNCWFDGEVRVEGNVGRFTGGIAGRVMASNGQNVIQHCLNTSDLSSTVINRGMNIGGIIGNIQSQARVTIEDCLTVGDIIVDYTSATGSFVGNVETRAAVIVKNTYVRAEGYTTLVTNVNGTMTGAATAHSEAMLTGTEAYRWTELDFENYWAVVEDGTPILKSFASEVPSLDGIKKGFDTSWYDASKPQYVLTTPEELYGFAILSYTTDFTGKTIKLGNDIVLNEGDAADWAEKAPKNSWIPISTYGYPFEGTFDGQGHSISGMYLYTCGDYGMFGETGSSSIIMNLKLENGYLEAYGSTIGSLVGRAAGTIFNVYSNSYVTGSSGNVGGLVGQVSKSKSMEMTSCWFDGKVTNTGNKSNTKKIGGLIGTVRSNCVVTNCLNTGIVDASVFNYNQSKTETPTVVPIAGGIIGYVEKEIPLTIQNCLNTGEILVNEAATAAYASIIGYIDGDVTAYNLYATKESCENYALKQSLSGQVCPVAEADIIGYKAYQWTLLDFNNYWAVDLDGTPVLKSFVSEVPSIEGIKKEYDISWYTTDAKTFVLDSREDLFGFQLMTYNTDFAEKTVKLGKNITVNTGDAAKWAKNAPKYAWTPIGSEKYSFKGTFDGGMHSISGLYVKTDKHYSGFFSVLTEVAAVKNLKIVNSYYESSADFLATIVGAGNADLSNIYSDAILVSSANTASGLVGRITKDVKITNCWFNGSATVTGTGMPNRRAAGIVGYLYSGKITLSHCLNTGTIAAPNYVGTNSATSKAVVPMIGGLIGYVGSNAELVIDDSLNTGLVTCNPAATTGYSSIVGYSDGKTTVKNTFATVESCEKPARGKVTGAVTTFKEKEISGYAGYQWMNLDFDKYWAVVVSPTASTPVLKSFASKVPSLAGVEKLFDTSWYDESKTEYVLYDKADLNGLAFLSNSTDFAGKTIKLGADIVVNADMNNPAYNWDPIGSKEKAFAGTFDGCMHTISGLYVNTDVECAGLFARTDTKATVKNLILKNSHFESTAMNLGSIAGIGHGTFEKIKSEATVVGHNARVGGLIGMNSAKGTSLANCWFAGTVTNKGNGEGLRGTGGLVAVSYSGSELTITNCLNTGTVDAIAYEYNQKTATNPQVVVLAGGLVGWVRSDAVLKLGDSLNTGEVKVSNKSGDSKNGFIGYGSVVGYVDGLVENSGNFYTTAESSPRQMNNGKTGLVVVNKSDIMGVKGYQWNKIDLDFEKQWTFVVDDITTTDVDETDTPILQVFAGKVVDVANVVQMLDYSWKDKAAGTQDDPYMIMDVGDLYGLSELSQKDSFTGKYFKLGADITVNTGNAADWATEEPEYSWTPIGTSKIYFKGNFDGDMHTISGLYRSVGEVQFNGLFARTDSATIKNLRLVNCYFKNEQQYFGSISGYDNAGTFESIYTDAIVYSASRTGGGLIGRIGNTTINNCWFDGSVTSTRSGADNRIGGLAGVVYTGTNKITNCLNSGIITASNTTTSNVYTGGLMGIIESAATVELKSCLNVGMIKYKSGSSSYGSIVGKVNGKLTLTAEEKSYTASDTCSAKGYSSVNLVGMSRTNMIGAKAETNLAGFDFKDVWSIVPESTPVLKAFASIVYDTSWYDAGKSEYVLKDKGDLYGFAVLSRDAAYNGFEGKIIKLGSDIIVNKGNAGLWESAIPNYIWVTIGTTDNPFKGTFDGCGHTISGLYISTGYAGGMFGVTADIAKVMNFKLVNSYFNSTASSSGPAYIGSIAGVGKGTFHSIYSSAIVNAKGQRVGGLIGNAQGNTFAMTNCWFDGSVKSGKTSDVRIGGLIGSASDGTGFVIDSCLNTGSINASGATSAEVRIGGLVGHVQSAKTLELKNSLNIGKVTYNTGTGLYGSLVGAPNTVTTVTNCFATNESCAEVGTTVGTKVAEADIKGDKAKESLKALLENSEYWTVGTDNKFPLLKSFEDIK